MITDKEAEGIAFGQLLATLDKQTTEDTALRLALIDLQDISRGHATLPGILALLARMSDKSYRSRQLVLRFYRVARYPVGSSIRIQVLDTINLVGLMNAGERLELMRGSYTLQVVEASASAFHKDVPWVVPEGMNHGMSLESLLEQAGVTGGTEGIVQLLED